MEAIDSLKRNDEVTITVYGADGTRLYQTTDKGYHSIIDAIRETVGKAKLDTNLEDCVFEVTNQKTDVSHRYRLNAHGNLKLIV